MIHDYKRTMLEPGKQHCYSLRKTFLLPLRTFCLRFVLPRRCVSSSSTAFCGRPPFSMPAPNVSTPGCFFCFPPSENTPGRSFLEDGTQVNSVLPSIDLLMCSDGRLLFGASFLLAPNVSSPRESRRPSWLALRGAIRTEVHGLAAFCFRLALMYSRSRSRSLSCVSC